MAIALVAESESNGPTSPVDTASQNSSGATLLIVSAHFYDAATSVVISDSNSNDWNALTKRVGTTLYSHQLYYAYSKSGGNLTVGSGHTARIAWSGTGLAVIIFISFSGTDQGATNPFDQESGNANDAPTTIKPGSLTPAAANSLFVTGVSHSDTGALATIDSSFIPSPAYGVLQNIGNNIGGNAAYKIISGSGAQDPTWTSSGTVTLASAMAVFKPASGAAAPADLRVGYNPAARLV